MNGRVELIFGSMFSGKTEELMRRLKRATIAGKKIQLFKPEKDNRYDANIMTHDGSSAMKAIRVREALEILHLVDDDTDVVGIDEAQFFELQEGSMGLPEAVQYLADNGKRIVLSGLDMWATKEPIPVMGRLACIADRVDKLHAICIECGEDAYISHRTNENTDTILVGGTNKYKALCRTCSRKATLDRIKIFI